MIRPDEVVVDPDGDGVELVADGEAAPIHYPDADHTVVGIAASDLADDVERVAGISPAVCELDGEPSSPAVVVGTYGSDEYLTRFVDEHVDGHGLSDERERFLLAALEDTGHVLIAGSDPRGTTYGIYELSERIGVSPWYWWADVPPDERDAVVLSPGVDVVGPPSVTHRGIFLNDEDWGIRPWSAETHEPDAPMGPETYARVFELLLRLKANTVWPAMHPGTTAFYRREGNREVAERYAIQVGTSHCEPMHRNNVAEWDPEERGEWNYATNREAILEYWEERVADVAGGENLFTIGMRGIHDSGFAGGETAGEKVELLQRAIDDQRDLLAEYHDDVTEVPQVFCPYKEALDLYRAGVDVPEDVCLVWPNDNHGYVRQLPTPAEREREGCSGIYYHLSYWGRPHDYLWLASTPPALVWEELRKAYDHGAREVWIANVGDVKPTEKETEFFLDLAWNVGERDEPAVREWLERWAGREFGTEHAREVADLLSEYYRLGFARKPEHLGWNRVYPNTQSDEPGFSFVDHGDEARRRLEAYERIEARATEVYESLPESARDAFYQLVVYPVRCAALMNRKVLDAARSRLYARQGRVVADEYAESARAALESIESETAYYNRQVVDGKWAEMTSHGPRDLPVFGMPATATVDGHEEAALGVAIEGQGASVGGAEHRFARLPPFDETVDRRFVDVYNRGSESFEWTAETSDEWLSLSAEEGEVETEERLWVAIDRDTVPDDGATGEIEIRGAGGRKTIRAEVAPRADGDAQFVESDGTVAVEAERYTRHVSGEAARWKRVDGLGRVSGTSLMAWPTTAATPPDDVAVDAPRLDYEMAFSSTGAVTVRVHCVPTHPVNDEHELRYAVAFDENDPTLVPYDADGGEHDPEWQTNVLRGSAITESEHEIDEPGVHTLRLWPVDAGVVVDRILVETDESDRSYLGPPETRRSDPD